jgi:hypothetical protein
MAVLDRAGARSEAEVTTRDLHGVLDEAIAGSAEQPDRCSAVIGREEYAIL